jgi:hypothetical protein
MQSMAAYLWYQRAVKGDPDDDWTKDESGDEAESHETF